LPDTTTAIPTVPPTALVKLREEIMSRDLLIHELRTQRDMAVGKVEQIGDKDKQIRLLLVELAEMKAQRKGKEE
jgi:hypothetical protein